MDGVNSSPLWQGSSLPGVPSGSPSVDNTRTPAPDAKSTEQSTAVDTDTQTVNPDAQVVRNRSNALLADFNHTKIQSFLDKDQPLPALHAQLKELNSQLAEVNKKLDDARNGKLPEGQVAALQKTKNDILAKIDTNKAAQSSKVSQLGAATISQTERVPTTADRLNDPDVDETAPQTQLTGNPDIFSTKHAHISQDIGSTGAKNNIDRYSTVISDRNMCENALKHLHQERNEAAANGKPTASIDRQIDYYSAKLKNIDQYVKDSTAGAIQGGIKKLHKQTLKGTWMNSLGFRNTLKSSETFAEGVSKYIPIPPNMRYQHVAPKDPSEAPPVGFVRMGAMTDLSNGFINLSRLKDIERAPPNEQQRMIDEELQKLDKFEKQPTTLKGKIKSFFGKDHLNAKQHESIAFARDQLMAMKRNPAAIGEVVQQREMRVRDQFMHLVAAQAEKGKIKNGKLDLAHVALLNPKKCSLDKTGWMHDEQNMLKDMQAMFSKYNGAYIKFHPDGPFVDSKGVMHLKGDPATQKPIVLKAQLFNVNVQGSKIKDPTPLLQQLSLLAHNHPQIKDDPDYKSLQAKIAKGDSAPHEIAEDLALLLNKMGKGLSLGCMSVKDRTLAVSEGVVIKSMKLPPSEAQELQNKVWSGDCPSSQVLQDDTNVSLAKFMPHWIGSDVSAGRKFLFAAQGAVQFIAHGATN